MKSAPAASLIGEAWSGYMRKRWKHILIVVGVTVAAAGAGTWMYVWYYHPSPGTLPKVEIAVPAGFDMDLSHLLDFDLYTLSRAPGQAHHSSLVIFVGQHPQTFRPSAGWREKRGLVCGRSATWYAWQDSRGMLRQEAHLSLARPLGGHRIHAIISADDPSEVELLEKTVQAARLSPGPVPTRARAASVSCATSATSPASAPATTQASPPVVTSDGTIEEGG